MIHQLEEIQSMFRCIMEQLEKQQKQLDRIIMLETTLNAQIADLTNEVTNQTTVNQSALTLIQGFAAQLASAIASAGSAGATTAQLQALSDLQTKIASNDTSL